MRSANSPSLGPPPLLLRLYGADRVLSLRDLILHLSKSYSEAQALQHTLVQPYDHSEYSQTLLSGTFCVLNAGAPPLRTGFTLRQESNMVDKRPSESGRQLHGAANTESYRTNSVADSLLSPAWQLLLSRIGDTLMLYLLVNTSMFTCLANGCCLQLTGLSVEQVAREWRRTAAATGRADRVPGPPRSNQPQEPAVVRAAAAAKPAEPQQAQQSDARVNNNNNAARPKPSFIGPATQDPGLWRSIEDSEEEDVEEEVLAEAAPEVEEAMQRKPNRRPSSWQRRKARQAAAVAAAAMEVEIEGEIDPSLPSTQPLSDLEAQTNGSRLAMMENADRHPQHPEGNAPAGASGSSKAYGHSQWPRYMPKPSEMIINRNPVMYCSSFPVHPGFPAKHILTALNGRDDAGALLYSAIFDPKHSPVGRTSNLNQPKHNAIPPAPRQIPPKHSHLIPVLQSLIHRTSKCPFGLLLNLYCPLPRVLRKEKPVGTGANTSYPAPPGGGGEVRVGARVGGPPLPQPPPPPPPLVPDGEKDLNTLLDEMRAMEYQLEHAQKQQQAQQAKHGGISLGATSNSNPNLGRRRGKVTGLSQLVQEAGSQLDPFVAVGGHGSGSAPLMPHAPLEEAVGSLQDRTSVRTQPLASVTGATTAGQGQVPLNLHLGGSDEGLPATQPQDVTIEESAAQQAQQAQHMIPPPLPATANNALPESLSSCFVPHNQVTGFVWAVIRRCVPAVLLGGKRCRKALRQSIRRFVSLRRYEQMNVQQIMQHQKTSELKWLQSNKPQEESNPLNQAQAPSSAAGSNATTSSHATNLNPSKKKVAIPPSQAAAQQRLVMLWLGWLFSVIVVPLLRAHFFCTESEAYRQQVFYYRKPVWYRLAAAAVDGLVQGDAQFAPMDNHEAEKILSSRRLGVARLRLLPKRVGMRFIVNMGKKAKLVLKSAPKAGIHPPRHPQRPIKRVREFPSINSMLSGIHQILKMEASRQPDAFGASLFGYNDAYCRLQPFIRTWRAAAAAGGAGAKGEPRSQQQSLPYIVSVDVSRAFDHVDVNMLLDLIKDLLQSEQYIVLKYTELIPSLGDIRILKRKLALAVDDIIHSTPEEGFPSRAGEWALTRKGKIFIDGVVYEKISRKDALYLLEQHLRANLVYIRKTWHYQCRGIAQGSTLSTMLCCLYMAKVEREYINPLIKHAAAGLSSGLPMVLPSGNAFSHISASSLRGPAGAAGSGVTGASSRGMLTALAAAAGSPVTHSGGGGGAGGGVGSLSVVTRRTVPSIVGGGGSNRGVAGHSLLLRLVDDWLLMTRHRAVAEAIARRMLEGIPAFNVHVNPDKTKLSFQLTLPPAAGGPGSTSAAGAGAGAAVTVVQPSVYTTGDGSRFIKWCGLLFNVETLEIQGDYTRYAGEHISTSLTLPLRRGMGSALGFKLCHYLRPKVHPLLMDPAINSPTTIRVNIHQAFAIGAMKFHCYVRAMPVAPSPGSKVLMDAIETGINFMCKLTRPRRVGAVLRPGVTVACDPGLSPAHVRYLGLHAFRKVLLRKQASYKELLGEIEEALGAPACARCAKALAPAVDDKRSTILDAILY